MEDQYLDLIYESLNKSFVDEKTTTLLSQFMDAYYQTLDEHLNAPVPNQEVINRLQKLTGPINAALNMPEPQDGSKRPAVDFIKEKIQNHGMEMEKGFAKVLKNPNAPSVSYEDEPLQINGFSFAIIVVCFTIVVGMVLGALLFLIK